MKNYKTERQKLVEQYQNLKTNDELLAAQALYYKQKKQRESNHEEKQSETKSGLKPEQGNNTQKEQFKQSTLIIGDILEKNTANIGSHLDNNSSFIVTEKGFPSVIKHSAKEIESNVEFHQNASMWHHKQFLNITNPQNTDVLPQKKQNVSLFAQRMQQNNNESLNDEQIETKDDSHPMMDVFPSPKINKTNDVSFIKKLNLESNIITEDDIDNIASENDSFLKQQNESEIFAMREELMSTLDPQLIALLTGKKKEKQKEKKKRKLKISYDNNEWVHPLNEVRESFDASMDLNNDIPGPTQKEKMEWMEPLNVKDEENKYKKTDAMPLMIGDNPLSYYRFGFDGKVLCDSKGIINDNKEDTLNLGLHHHGEEPLKPGYTINELIHLCKSSVANQRNTAIKSLMHIVKRMRRGEYGMDYSEYLWILLQEHHFIRLIVDILSMEKNVSCIIPILDLLYAIIVPIRTLFDDTPTYYNAETDKLVFDGYHILCNTLPNITPIAMDTNQSLCIETKDKKNEKNKMDDIWKCDVILALIRSTHIIRYFNNILSKYIIPNMNGTETMYMDNILPVLLDIVMTFVGHHPQIIDVIVKYDDFMHNLLSIMFCNNNKYKCKVIDIVCIMCQLNVVAIRYLVRNNKLNDFKTFIVEGIDNINDEEKLHLSISSLQLWRVSIKYGYDLNAFTDLFPKLIKLFSTFSMELNELQQKQMRGFLNIIHILLESLVPSNISHLPSITTVSWNQIATLTEKVISLFDSTFNDSNTDWLCIAGLCHIIAAYFSTLREQNDDTLGQPFGDLFCLAKRQCMILTKKYIATWCRAKENVLLSRLLLNKRNWTKNNTKNAKSISFPFLDGLLSDIPLSIAVVPRNDYLSKCDCLLSIIKMVTSFIKINSKIIAILISSRFMDGIGRILFQITSKHFHFRLNRSLRGLLFNYWRIEFLLAFEILILCDLCLLTTLNVTNIHSAASVLMECIPPGYMHYADILLNKFILSKKYLRSMKQFAVKYLRKSSNKHLLDGTLTTFYVETDLNLFDTQLKDIFTQKDKYLSRAFSPRIARLCDMTHSYSNSARIESLCGIPSMVPTFWMLQPLINLYKHNIAAPFITTLLHFYFIISRCYDDDLMDEIIIMNDDDDDDVMPLSHHYWCNIPVWDAYRSIATLYLSSDSNVYCDCLNGVLISELINQCWNRIYCNNNDIYLCDKNDPSSSCIIDNEMNEINNDLNMKSLGREWQAFYTKLVEKYETDSFGDALFAKVVFFQQQNNYNKQFRIVVWSSMDSLCVLLKNEYPPNILKWKSYFIPFETDKIIIDFQFESIQQSKFNNLANYRNSSFLYFVAVLQVSHYIWNRKGNKQGYNSNMMNNVFNQCHKSVICDIINCDWKNIHGLRVHGDDPLKAINQLKQFLKIGKQKIIMHQNNEFRTSVLKKDFVSLCDKFSLF